MPWLHPRLLEQLRRLGLDLDQPPDPSTWPTLLAALSAAYAEADAERRDLAEAKSFVDSVIENLPNMVFVKDAHELRFVRFNRAGEELLGIPRAALIGKNDFDLFPPEQATFFTNKDRDVLALGEIVDIRSEPIDTHRGTRLLHTRKVPIPDQDGQPAFLLGISEDVTQELARTRRLQQQQDALLRLTSNELAAAPDLATACRNLVEVSAETLGVARVSVWVLETQHPAIRCLDHFSLPDRRHTSGHLIHAGEAPAYFAALSTSQLLVTADLLADPRTCELQSIADEGVMALMDAPILVSGELVGVLCHEHVGSQRDWLPDEQNFAIALAHLVSLVFETDRLRRAQDQLRRAQLATEAALQAKSSFLATVSHEMRTPLNAIVGFSELLLNTADLGPYVPTLQTIHSSSELLLALIDRTLDFSKIEAGRLELERIPLDLEALVDDVIGMIAPQAAEKGLTVLWAAPGRLETQVLGDPMRLRQILVNLLGNAVKFTAHGAISLTLRQTRSAGDEGWLTELAVSDTGIGIAPDRLEHLFEPFTQADVSTTRRYGGTGLGLAIARRLATLMGGQLDATSQPGQGSTFRLVVPLVSTSERCLDGAGDLTGVDVWVDTTFDPLGPLLAAQLAHWGAIVHEAPVGGPAPCSAEPTVPGIVLRRGSGEHAGSNDRPFWCARCRGTLPVKLESPLKPRALLAAMRTLAGLQPEKPSPAPAQTPERGLAESLPLRILVAEDNPVNQQVAQLLLASLGYAIDLVDDGQAAVAAAQSQPYDVILMDLHMPGLDGIEATRRLRAHTAPARGPWVIAVTADALAEARLACSAAGVDDFLTKPIRIVELRQALERAGASV